MSNGQTRFPYLLITKHQEVGMHCGVVSIDGKYVRSDDGLHSFWTDKSFDELFEEFSKPEKEFALIRVDNSQYIFAGGQLASVMDHIS